MVKVSIIVPVYNVEKYLSRCLDSLVNQTLNDIQIIIVNDGSTDNSHRIVEEYKSAYHNKILYIRKENGGLASARNEGLRYAVGEYIGYVDSDDYVDNRMFERLYANAKNENSDMAVCDYYNVYGDKLKKKSVFMDELCGMFAIKETVWNKVIRKEILDDTGVVFSDGLIYEDLEWYLKLVAHIKTITYVEEPLYYYVQRRNSICSSYNERVRDIFHIWDNIICHYIQNNLYNTYKSQLEYLFARSILSSSFFRIVKIREKKLRQFILKENFNELAVKFPNWKKNSILKNKCSKVNIFIRTQNIITYYIYSELFSMLHRLKKRG